MPPRQAELAGFASAWAAYFTATLPHRPFDGQAWRMRWLFSLRAIQKNGLPPNATVLAAELPSIAAI
jgi:hypothetical protein